MNAKYDKLKLFPNQEVDGDAQECVALSVTDIAGNIDGLPYSPDFTYAMTLRLQGIPPTTAGSDPLAGMQSAVGYGLLPLSAADFSSLTKGELYAANWQNYSKDDRDLALTCAKNGLVNVLGSGDYFDSVKLGLVNHHQGILVALRWYSSFLTAPNGVLSLPDNNPFFSRHAIAVYDTMVDGVTEYLVGKPWLGPTFGDGGYVKISRAVANATFSQAYTFDQNAVRWATLLGIAITRFPYLADFVPGLLNALKPNSMPPSTTPPAIVQPVPPSEVPVALLWDTPANVKHSCRVIMDDYGLSWVQKDIICACIEQESQFNPHAIGKPNSDGTRDFGLAQFNDGKNPKTGKPYWIGPGAAFASVEEVLNHPEKNVRVMVQMYLAGKLGLWASFSTGAYKKYL